MYAHHTKRNNGGFTLIETVIYIGLFAIIMTMSLLSVHQLLQGFSQVSGKATVQDEESFVLRKIDWALGGISNTLPAFAGTPSSITIRRYDGNQVRFRLSGTGVEISENGGSYVPITTDNVRVSNLSFTYITPTGNGPAGIMATVTINGQTASTTRYIRK